MKLDGFGMDTASLAGPLEVRLGAMRDAGFTQVMLSSQDVADHVDGTAGAGQALRASGLRPTGFRVLRDFEGLAGRLHDYKVDIAKAMIQTCAALGSKVLLASSSASVHAAADRSGMMRDLAKLAMLAVPHGIRIAYQAVAWGRFVHDYQQAWELVDEVDCPNLGIGLDSFHMTVSGSSFEDLELIDPRRIFLVQLADFMWQEEPDAEARRKAAEHFRVFPGEGAHSERIAELVARLDELGYRGDYSFEVLNDDYRQLPRELVAQRARKSALWLREDVLQRMTPLPTEAALRAS